MAGWISLSCDTNKELRPKGSSAPVATALPLRQFVASGLQPLRLRHCARSPPAHTRRTEPQALKSLVQQPVRTEENAAP